MRAARKERPPRAGTRDLFASLAVFLLLFLPTLVLVWVQEREFRDRLWRATTQEADQHADRMRQIVAGRLTVLRTLSDMLAREPEEAALRLDGVRADLIHDLGGLTAVFWISPQGELQRVLPLESQFKALGRNVLTIPETAPYFERARREQSEQISAPVRPAQGGGWGLFVFMPVVSDGQLRGVLGGFFAFQDLIDFSLRVRMPSRFDLLLRNQDRIFYERWQGEREQTANAGVAEWYIAGHRYQLEVLPGVGVLDVQRRSRTRHLALGALFAVVLASLWRWRLAAACRQAEVGALERAGIAAGGARQAMAEAVRQAEDGYRPFFEHAPFGYLVADMQGLVTLANAEAAALLGLGEATIAGRPLIDVLGAGREGRIAAARLLDRVERGEEILEEEVQLQSAAGRRFWCSVSVQIVRSADGEFLGSRFILLDNSQRRALEERLRQSAKMEAVGRLAGGISHDFNNLLTAILGFARLGLTRLEKGSPLERDLREIEKAGRRAASLIAQLLAFSRPQGGAVQRVDLDASIRDMQPMLRRLVREDIDLDLRLEAGGSALIDPAQIEQVVVNLVVNSMEAIPGLGRIEVATFHVDEPSGPQVCLRVQDDGIGMPREVRERIFEPFFSTKQQQSGTGLGLATVYAIVDQAGGTIKVESEPGQGATFVVCLPQVEAAAPRPEMPPAVDEPSPTGRERVLLVEDEDLVREMAHEMLETLGYTVMAARDGKDALEQVAGLEQEIDLLLTDVVMPRMGGDELYQRLRAAHPALKVLFTSGYTDNAFIRQAVEQGEVPLLPKPYTLDSLAIALRRALNR
jgi:two-component system cell cycle sensor histidine kinase/response regulator CckA